jgi:DNA-binding XRE family transcriptional regulator
MAKPISELLNSLPAERQAAIKAKTAMILAQLDLPEIRKNMDMTQQDMATALGISQPRVAKLEKGGDVQLSTLKNYLFALGGDLEVRAKFSDGSCVQLNI